MAFCPNCGTPNTDQAEKCVSCAFDLAPKSKGKFKGTIMMSGVQAPVGRPPAAAPQPAAEPVAAAPNRNLAFEKTMLGGPAVVPPPPAAAAAPTSAADLGRAATVEGPAPQFSAPAAPSQPASFTKPASPEPADPVGWNANQRAAGFSNVNEDFPSPPKPNTGKVLAIGCAVVAVMTLVITGLLYVVAKDRLKGLFGSAGDDPAAQQWRLTLAEALSQVSGLCQTNCASAANFFHPSLEGVLLTEAKSLDAGALQKLSDPAQSQAQMLSSTQDGIIATNLHLDPQLCVRVTSGSAKVVGCSVINPATGKPDMRIVHMAGVETL